MPEYTITIPHIEQYVDPIEAETKEEANKRAVELIYFFELHKKTRGDILLMLEAYPLEEVEEDAVTIARKTNYMGA